MTEIDKLLQGFQRFRGRYFEENRQLFDQLVRQGQHPQTLVIGCSDSRVDPAILLDADPGDLFVLRNVANLVPPCESGGIYHGTSAALEFAVCGLKVKNIIILGHAHCGGIQALMEGRETDEGFIGPWVAMATPARNQVRQRWPEASKAFQLRACERAAILVSLNNMMTFPFVHQRVEAGELRLFGWYFDLESGELMEYDPERRRFHDLYFD
ncbi:MAG: carbonic anhydrase [Candidatus Competibacteraceae bacterium]|nr:carbonic anhydrase [Candidatus Competibacteraceae bacterium]